MTEEPPLDVAAAFTPFTEVEARRMRRYRDKVKELSECELSRKSLTLNVKGGSRAGESRVIHEGDRAERSDLLMMFRPVYLSARRDVSGFLKVAAMLRKHAQDKRGDAASQAVEWIEEYEADHQRALVQHHVLEIRVEGGKTKMSPETVLDLFLYADGFHMTDTKATYLEGLSPVTRSTFEYTYLLTVLKLSEIYWQFGSFPNSILHEPSLLP